MTLPAELRTLPQWVAWRWEDVQGKPKPTKVPYRSCEPRRKASTTDPATWSTYDDAVKAVVDGDGDGIGFVFTGDDPYTGVDFDDCVDGETIDPTVAALIGELDSYSEFSPSGTGVHTIVRAELNGGRNRTGKTSWGGAFEVYDRDRFFCMTGDLIPAAPLSVNARQGQLDRARTAIFPPQETGLSHASAVTANVDDSELLTRARNARNGRDFDALYSGGHSHASQSEADLALCNMLAFWTGPDPGRIDRLFRGSGLMRPKWDETRGESTYGADTIKRAIEGRTEFYRDESREPAIAKKSAGTYTGADTIRARRIRWAWKGRLALGYVSLWSGESSLGKSTFACWLIAQLTHARLEGHLSGAPVNVLIIASEDARADVWIPRLEAAGANLAFVKFQNQDREWNLRDGIGLIAENIDRLDAKLV